MEVWGSPANVKWTMSDKLEAKSNSCLLVGYPKGTNGYQFYTSLEQKVFISKHVVFIEKEILLEDSGSKSAHLRLGVEVVQISTEDIEVQCQR